jgi:hypothetical protein
VAQLADTNNFLQGHLEQVASENQDLQEQLVAMQQQLHQMNLAQAQRQPAFQQPIARPPMPQMNPMPPMPPMLPPQMFQQQQFPQVNTQHPNHMQWQQQTVPQGNNQNRGRGNSRRRGYFQGDFQTPVNAPPAAPQQPSNVKKNANNKYCWTHGHDIGKTHTSATCGNPAPNHNFYATKWNTMGGSNKHITKTVWPVQKQQNQQNYNNNTFQQQGYGQN